MQLPKNKRERDEILHANSQAEEGTRQGGAFAESYHRTRPNLSIANVLATADSLHFTKSKPTSYVNAFCLQFVVRYMGLEGYDVPFATADTLVTSDQNTKGNDAMLNKIMLIGNLGRDPELNVTGDGTPVTKFSLAVSRRYKTSSGEQREETEWFNIVMWRKLAEISEQYLHKGSKVYIEGRLSQRKYTDREGVQRTSVEVTASEMEMLTPKGEGTGNGYVARPSDNDDAFLPDFPDDEIVSVVEEETTVKAATNRGKPKR